jgi:hypothetical protein
VKSCGAEDAVKCPIEGQMLEIGRYKSDARPKAHPQIFASCAQHVLGEVHCDDMTARQKRQQLAGKFAGSAACVEKAFIAAQGDTVEYLFSPTKLRRRDAVVSSRVPLARFALGH